MLYYNVKSTNTRRGQVLYALQILTLLLQCGVVFIGFPAQISRNYEKGESGEPVIRVVLLLSAFLSRFTSTAFEGIWYIWIPDLFGVALLSVSCSQVKRPRNRAAKAVHYAYGKLVRLLLALKRG